MKSTVSAARDLRSGRPRVLRAGWITIWAAAVIVLLTVSGAVQGGSPAKAAATDVGYRDFSFAATGVDAPTRDKPQSKVWFNDGIWWASMFDKSTEEFHIHRYDRSAHAWTDTGTLVDERNNSLSDTLWDGNKLYVASAGTSRSSAADSGRFMRYSYDAAAKKYTRDAGFPVTVTEGGMEAIVLERDTTGQFWVTYTRGASVLVNHSSSDAASWGKPFKMPAQNTNITSDDISAVVAFDSKIGVMWSDQNSDAMYFATHDDGDPDSEWQLQTANQGPGIADDHINLKSLQSDAAGRVYAAVKTELDKTGNSSAPQILLMERGLDGKWTNHVFGRVSDKHTRPNVLIDQQNKDLYVLATAPTGGGTIYYKKSPLSNISFETGRGTPFIKSSTDPNVNDLTSTKQPLNNTTGLMGLAADDATGYYLHNILSLGGSADTTAPETSIDSGPSGTVSSDSARFEFSSSESGSTFECALDGAAFASCASPKDYTGLPSGDHTFQVRATDASGNTDPTPASRSWTVEASTDEPPPDEPLECTITGTSSNDTLKGTSGDDVICGLGGNDTIRGLGGNDILRGGDGADKLFGGPGDDTLDGGAGLDRVNFDSTTTGVSASLSDGTATGEGNDTLTSIEDLIGSKHGDTLTGSAGDDRLNGAGGDDTIRGGDGNDTIIGGAAADKLYGEDGNDTVNSKDGVSGNDTLDGGPGTDKKVTDATEASVIGFP